MKTIAENERVVNVVKPSMSADTLWRQAIDPRGVGLAEAIAADIASYTGEPLPDVLAQMRVGTAAFKALWESRRPDVHDPSSVEQFYRNQFVEAYELAQWHAGGLGYLPLNYAHAALFAGKHNARRVLDYGSGIGSGILCFADVGCEVHAADVADELLKFVRHRANRRGVNIQTYDLQRVMPPHRYFDIITCFDVLEHVPDPRGKLNELASYLRPGGFLFVNLMVSSEDPERPMHISSAGDILKLIRATPLKPEWQHWGEELHVLSKRRYGRLRNAVASIHDRWASLRRHVAS